MTLAMLKKDVREVVFRLDSRLVPRAHSVILVGAFNRWDSAVHPLTAGADGCWTVSVALAPGTYPYLFLVDGVPWNDPQDDGRTPSEWGGEYSIRVVG